MNQLRTRENLIESRIYTLIPAIWRLAAMLRVTTCSTFASENSALGAEHGVGEHVALVVEVSLAPLRLSTDYSPLLPKQSKIASPGIA
jgi:hypothetical protein